MHVFPIGGGVQNSEIAVRMGIYASTGGGSGVTRTQDLVCKAESTPVGSIRVFPGSATVAITSGPASGQSYAYGLPSETVVPISPNTTSNPRFDAVVLEIADPHRPGSGIPSSVTNYGRIVIVPGVANTAKSLADFGWSNKVGLLLAIVAMPANTSTVAASQIFDKRELCQPKTRTDYYTRLHSGPSQNITTTTPFWVQQLGVVETQVPEWATHIQAHATLSGLDYIHGSSAAHMFHHLRFGVNPGDGDTTRTAIGPTSESTKWHASGTQSISFSMSNVLPPQLAPGSTAKLGVMMWRTLAQINSTTSYTGFVKIHQSWYTGTFSITFQEHIPGTGPGESRPLPSA